MLGEAGVKRQAARRGWREKMHTLLGEAGEKRYIAWRGRREKIHCLARLEVKAGLLGLGEAGGKR